VLLGVLEMMVVWRRDDTPACYIEWRTLLNLTYTVTKEQAFHLLRGDDMADRMFADYLPTPKPIN